MPLTKDSVSRIHPQRSNRPFLTLSLLLSCQVACSSGVVELSEVEDMGPVKNAIWYSSPDIVFYQLTDSGTLSTRSSRFLQNIRLTADGRRLCEGQRAYYEAWEEATLELLAASANGSDAAAVCAGMSTFLDQYIEAIEQLPSSERSLVFHFMEEGALDELDYVILPISEVDEDDDTFGFLTYQDPSASPSAYYQLVRDAWDPETCTFDQGLIDTYTWTGEQWTFESGTLTLDTVLFEEGANGTFDGALLDQDGQGAGTVSGSFESEYCDRGGEYELFRP